jgi:uncharacterized protein
MSVDTKQYREDYGNDIFVIEDGDEYIVYSPLRQVVFSANASAVKEIQELIDVPKDDFSGEFFDSIKATGILESIDPEAASSLFLKRKSPLTRISLALTLACNLECIYCYASCGDSDVIMSEDTIYAAIETIAENCHNEGFGELRLSFHGTGEVTLVWNLLEKSISFAEKTADKYNLTPAFSLITNATAITPKIADYILEHDIHLSISMDGYKEIQDIQRPKISKKSSFESVMKGIGYLQEREIKFSIRATCTQYNVNHLSEIVEFFASDVFRGARGNGGKIHIEPVELCGRAAETGVQGIDADVFIENYKKAVLVGDAHGIRLNCSGDLKGGYQEVFCGANGNNFIVFPNGNVSCCSRVSSADHELADAFIYGKYDAENKTFNIDQKKLESLQQLDVTRNDRCKNCYAKWHCAGNCIERSLSSTGNWEMMCYVTRELVKWRLHRLLECGKA